MNYAVLTSRRSKGMHQQNHRAEKEAGNKSEINVSKYGGSWSVTAQRQQIFGFNMQNYREAIKFLLLEY